MARTARSHPDGFADLSVGTPVDPTPQVVQGALADAAQAPGYPATAGTQELRDAARGWLARSLDVDVSDDEVIPTIGSKEMVALLPMLLGLGVGSRIVVPTLAYPTYDVGARLVGAEVVTSDDVGDVRGADLVWVNSPGNPTGEVHTPERMREIVQAARSAGAVLVSDECYAEFGWSAEPVSALNPAVSGGSSSGIIALHSLSKRSNMAGYRFGLAVGDPALIGRILQIRKHMGLMVPAPIQAAAIAALGDDAHVGVQRGRYEARRAALIPALIDAGFRIDHSVAGLYLWATRGEPCWDTVAALAEVGVLVTPGDFYGVRGDHHVRVAVTATDDAVATAVDRLARLAG